MIISQYCRVTSHDDLWLSNNEKLLILFYEIVIDARNSCDLAFKKHTDILFILHQTLILDGEKKALSKEAKNMYVGLRKLNVM